MFQTGLEKSFIITDILKTRPVTYKIKDLNWEQIVGTFYNEELRKSVFQRCYVAVITPLCLWLYNK
jgi:hypothetical protein